jgi:hypothetical protein
MHHHHHEIDQSQIHPALQIQVPQPTYQPRRTISPLEGFSNMI